MFSTKSGLDLRRRYILSQSAFFFPSHHRQKVLGQRGVKDERLGKENKEAGTTKGGTGADQRERAMRRRRTQNTSQIGHSLGRDGPHTHKHTEHEYLIHLHRYSILQGVEELHDQHYSNMHCSTQDLGPEI